MSCLKAGTNATGKAFRNNNTCECRKSFVYQEDGNSCQCPEEVSVIVGGVCIGCSSMVNSTGLAPTSTQCQCKPTFQWINNNCLCNTTSAFAADACFDCTSNPGTNGLAADRRSCNCKTNFTKNPATGGCLCGVNSMLLGQVCYDCSKIKYSLKSTDSTLSQCLCLDSLVFEVKNFTCGCNATSIFITSRNACSLCTHSLVGGVLRTNNQTCTCGPGFKWSTSTQECICSAEYNIKINGVCKSCKSISNSANSTANSTACKCAPTFTWLSNSTCGCPPDAVIIAGKCFICNSSVGATGVASSTTCACSNSIVNTWNAFTLSCNCGTTSIKKPDGSCALCSSLSANTNGIVDSYNCKCTGTFFWDNIQMKCISCSNIANGLSKANDLTCNCKSGFFFDIFTNTCKSKCSLTGANLINCLNCDTIPLSSKTKATLDTSRNITALDPAIISAQYTNILKNITNIAIYQCNCDPPSNWDNIRKRCIVL